MPAPISSDLVWKEIEKRSFAVLSYVNPKSQARSAGIVYVVIDRVLYVRVAKASWKAKHILLEIRPTGHFVTYGVGVSLLDMRHPQKARGRVPVG